MADRWFYAHDEIKIGPYSGRELRDLADSGEIVVTDTIWKEGIEQGVLARKVKNLFVTILDDHVGFELMERYPYLADASLYSSDYPHSVTLWPRSQEHISKLTTGIRDQDVAKILSGNSQSGDFTPDSATRTASGTTTFTLDGRTARYYVVWITKLPPGNSARIEEVKAR